MRATIPLNLAWIDDDSDNSGLADDSSFERTPATQESDSILPMWPNTNYGHHPVGFTKNFVILDDQTHIE